MAKYRITSIPQFAPGGETNWPPDWVKNLMQNQRKVKSGGKKLKRSSKAKKSSFKRSPKEEIEEQEIIQNQGTNIPFEEAYTPSTWSDVWPAQRDQYEKLESTLPEFNIDPNQVDKPTSERTGLELLSTQPTIGGGYGYKRDPFTGELKIVPAGTQTYEKDIFGRVIKEVQANPDAPVDYQGKKLTCGPGSRPWKGVCVTNEEYAQIQVKNEADLVYRDDEEKKRIEEEKKRIDQERRAENKKRTLEYFDKYYKTEKSDKIEPLHTFPVKALDQLVDVVDEKGNVVIDETTGKPKKESIANQWKKDWLLIKKDDKYEAYPKNIVQDRIWKKGFTEQQFENWWGLDPKQVREQVGSYIDFAGKVYSNETNKKLTNLALDKGISVEEAKKYIPISWGTQEGMSPYVKPIQDKIDQSYENFIEKSLDLLEKDLGVTVDKDGNVRYDTSKKADKQNINFDFYKDVYVNEYDEDGNIIGRKIDPVGAYTQKWINSAGSEQEKQRRRNKINEIRSSTEKKYKETSKIMSSVIPDIFAEPKEKDPSEMDDFEYSLYLQAQQNNNTKDQFAGMDAFYADQRKNLREARREEAQKENIKQAQDAAIMKETGFGEDYTKFMKEQTRIPQYQTYKDALNNPNITEGEKAKILKTLQNKDVIGALNYMLDKTDLTDYDAAIQKLKDDGIENPVIYDKDKYSYASQVKNLYGGDYYSKLLSTPRFEVNNKVKPQELSTGEKLWDALTNLGQTVNFAGRQFVGSGQFEDMWKRLPEGMSLNQAKELARTNPNIKAALNQDYQSGPLQVLAEMGNTLNPAHMGDELVRGYQGNGLEGLSDRSLELGKDALATLATRGVPAGTAFKLLRNAAMLNKGSGAFNTLAKGFNTLNRGLVASGVPGQYAYNYLTKSMPLYAFDAVRPYGQFHEGIKNLSKGETLEGLKEIGLGTAGVLPYLSQLNRNIPRLLEYTTPSGKTFGIGNPNLRQAVTLAENEKNFNDLFKGAVDQELVKLYPMEANYKNASQLLNEGAIFPKYTFSVPLEKQAFLAKDLQNLNAKEFALKNIGFKNAVNTRSLDPKQSLQFGTFKPPTTYSGKFGQLKFGQGKFYPSIFQGFENRPPVYFEEGAVGGLGSGQYKEGGISKTGCPPFCGPSTAIQALKKLGTTTEALTGIGKNLSGLASIIANPLSTTATLPFTQEPLEILRNTDLGETGDGWVDRMNMAADLKDLKYVGNEFNMLDEFSAAKTEESLNKLMQLAIEHDRTGYRQVSGEFRPTGGLLGGYGNSSRKYDMYEHHWGRPMSQVQHMNLSGVNLNDPVSLGGYQASTIPFEQYGYRAGIDDVNKGDALYLASLPEKYNRSYGPYQFKITMPTDFSSGNWKDWYEKYILSKKPYRLPEPQTITRGGYSMPTTRATPQPGEVLFDLGASKGKTQPLFGTNNILTGSGLNTRRWIGTYGTKVGNVDPKFQFTDLLNMSTEDYNAMENLRNSIIKNYNTGWRGQYKKGGMVMNLSKKDIDKYVEDGYIIEEE
jgi:hypothetical protein